jgi:TRAP-type C4-dicarboxylate transport system permease small subunit
MPAAPIAAGLSLGGAMPVLATFRSALEWVLSILCAALMTSLTVIILAAVITRKLGTPFGWYDEVASIGLAWVTYYGAALAALKRAHLGFPNLVAAAPPPQRVALLVVTETLVIGFFAIIAWYGWEVIVLLAGDTLVSLPQVPVSLSQSVIPVGAALFVLAELLTLPERFGEALRGATAHDPELAAVTETGS